MARTKMPSSGPVAGKHPKKKPSQPKKKLTVRKSAQPQRKVPLKPKKPKKSQAAVGSKRARSPAEAKISPGATGVDGKVAPKKRRFKHTTRARQQAREAQKSVTLETGEAGFVRAWAHAADVMGVPNRVRMRSQALMNLQEQIEHTMVEIIRVALDNVVLAGKKELDAKDLFQTFRHFATLRHISTLWHTLPLVIRKHGAAAGSDPKLLTPMQLTLGQANDIYYCTEKQRKKSAEFLLPGNAHIDLDGEVSKS